MINYNNKALDYERTKRVKDSFIQRKSHIAITAFSHDGQTFVDVLENNATVEEILDMKEMLIITIIKMEKSLNERQKKNRIDYDEEMAEALEEYLTEQ